jgi:probable HAF family extracellular repeat protein
MRRLVFSALAGLTLVACDESRSPVDPSPNQSILSKAPRYQITDLGTLGGTRAFARDMNDAGDVVGESLNQANQVRAFLWTREGGM